MWTVTGISFETASMMMLSVIFKNHAFDLIGGQTFGAMMQVRHATDGTMKCYRTAPESGIVTYAAIRDIIGEHVPSNSTVA